MRESSSVPRAAAAAPGRPKPEVPPSRGPPGNGAGDSAEMTLRLTQEHARIAEGMNDVVVRRLFSAGLAMEGALGLMGEHRAVSRIQHAIDELDLAIGDIRDMVFDDHRHDPAGERPD
jgi:hypothetical protein